MIYAILVYLIEQIYPIGSWHVVIWLGMRVCTQPIGVQILGLLRCPPILREHAHSVEKHVPTLCEYSDAFDKFLACVRDTHACVHVSVAVC